MKSHSDEVTQSLSFAMVLYEKAGKLLNNAIAVAESRETTKEMAARLREAKHDIASPLSVIYNVTEIAKRKGKPK
jgi:hypothetical protein